MIENVKNKILKSKDHFKTVNLKLTEEKFEFFLDLFSTNRVSSSFFDSNTLMLKTTMLEKYLYDYLFKECIDLTEDEQKYISDSAMKFSEALNYLEFEEREILIDILLKNYSEDTIALKTHSSRATINRKKTQAAQLFAITYLSI